MSTEPVTVLELLSSPEKWAKGYFSFNKYHQQCCPKSKDAVCWCLVGGLRRIYGVGTDAYYAAACKIRKVIDRRGWLGGDMAPFNDNPSTKFEDVVSVCREAGV